MKDEAEERKISEKQIKVVIFIVIIIMVVFIAVWGMVPGKIYEVSEVLENPAEFYETEIQVKGVVIGWNLSHNFTLRDQTEYDLTIEAMHSGPLPEGFGNNETVVVKGVFSNATGAYHIESVSIQIGCPSKY
jgi:cytochrome c-type biogenesis protein CcmE